MHPPLRISRRSPSQRCRVLTLPSELVSQIAGYFSGKSKFKNLLTICLLSRHWRDASRRYLYKRLRIHSAERLSQLLAHLELEPYIGRWVQVLRIQPGKWVPLAGEYEAPDGDWFYGCPEKLIGKLPAVRRLTFYGFATLDPVRGAKAFGDCAVAFSSVKELVFSLFSFNHPKEMIKFVCGFQGLKKLTLNHCDDYRDDEELGEEIEGGPGTDAILEYPCLETLSINSGFECIRMDTVVLEMVSSPLVKSVRKLAIFFWSHDSLLAVGQLLKTLGSALEELDIGTSSFKQVQDLCSLDLRYNTNLQKLSITDTPLTSTYPILQSLPSNFAGSMPRPCEIHLCLSSLEMPRIIRREPHNILKNVNALLPERIQGGQLIRVAARSDFELAVGLLGIMDPMRSCYRLSVPLKRGYELTPRNSEGSSHRVFLWLIPRLYDPQPLRVL